MAYQTKDRDPTRHAQMIVALKGTGFPASGVWATVVKGAQQLITAERFDAGHASVTNHVRTQVARGVKAHAKPSATTLTGACIPVSKPLSPAEATRLAVLGTMRHLWLEKRFGSHKASVLSLPMSYKD